MLLLKCQLASDMGCIRTNNEDMILFNGGLYRDETYEQKFELIPQARFTAFVADGMGGHRFATGLQEWNIIFASCLHNQRKIK